MSRDFMIKVDNVSKVYRLGAIGGTTLRDELKRKAARLRGKSDPTLKIGQENIEYGKEFLALDGISFEVKEGEALGIIGHNGAGKSTLLKLITRVTAPTSGKIKLNGRIASMLEVGTGFHPELTGRENIYMNGAILGMTKKEIDKKIDEIIEFSEVSKFIDTPVKRYSSGMYVKLAFSVAAHLDSEIMIMDEVLAVGDMAFQKKCLEKMRYAAKKEGRSVLYVSHNMNTITQLCDRCLVLEKGKKIFDGDVEKAISLYLSDSVTSMGVNIDLSKSRMSHLPQKVDAKITRLVLCGKELPVFDFGETVRMKLNVHSHKTLKDLSLRVELRTTNNAPVGLTMINGFADVEADSDNGFEFEMNFDGLVTGSYYVCLVLYQVDDAGNYIDLDAIYPAFSFDVQDVTNNLKLNWDHSNWGYIRFNDIKLLDK